MPAKEKENNNTKGIYFSAAFVEGEEDGSATRANNEEEAARVVHSRLQAERGRLPGQDSQKLPVRPPCTS